MPYFSYKATLCVSSDRYWIIQLNKTHEGVFMRGGCIKFLEDNSLGGHDLLLCTYEGMMHISVKIFGKNGLLRYPPEANATGPCNKSEKFNILKDVRKEEVESEFTHIRGVNLSYKSAKKEKNMKESTSMAEASFSAFPWFTLETKKSYVHNAAFLAVPKWFATNFLPKGRMNFVLRDPEGKPWDVVYVYNTKYRKLSGGWSHFVKGNGLRTGDTFTLELVAPKEMKVRVNRSTKKGDQV